MFVFCYVSSLNFSIFLFVYLSTIYLSIYLYFLNFNDFKFSVISIQEVWNVPRYFNTDIPGYHPLVYKLRNNTTKKESNKGGGVGCWVRDNIDFEILNDFSIFEDKVFESIFLKLKLSKNKFVIVGNIYRPPSTDIKTFNEKLDMILKGILNDKKIKQSK